MVENGNLLSLLENYEPFDESERISLAKLKEFASTNARCFDSDYFDDGHIVGSALVVDEELRQALLNHHTKLGKWLHFGGHSDGHPIVPETAMREAVEESGLRSLRFSPLVTGIFDINVHPIPQYKEKPPHLHYDVRFLLTADRQERFSVTKESKDIKWVSLEQIVSYNAQAEFLRMVMKVNRLRRILS